MTPLFTRLFLLYITLGHCVPGLGQSSVLIEGEVRDAMSGAPLELATIVVKDSTGELVHGGITDSLGQFAFRLPSGNIRLACSFVGFQTWEQKMDVGGVAIQEVRIALLPDVEQLAQAEIIAEKSQVEYRLDRKIFHVGKELQAIGGALDLIGQLPEIYMGPDGQISFRGSDQVQILLNGRPSPLSNQELLRQLTAADIVRIELITTPSARYQANGLSGLLNIVTQRKNRKGFRARADAYTSSNRQYQANFDTGYGTEQWGVQFRGTWNDRTTENRRWRSRQTASGEYEEAGQRTFDGRVKSLSVSADYLSGTAHQFSGRLELFNNYHDLISRAILTEMLPDKPITYTFTANQRHLHLSNTSNLNYRYTWKESEHFLEMEWHRSRNDNTLEAAYRTDTLIADQLLDYRNLIDHFAVDYNRPLPHWKVNWEGGLLYSRKKVTNRPDGQFLSSSGELSLFQYFERTFSLYSLLRKDWDKWQIQAGIRYENFRSTSILTASNRNQWGQFFPSLHLSFAPSERYRFQLAYNRRISRPNLWHLNPYSNPGNRYFQHQGNPGLQPEYSHNLELSTQFPGERLRFYPTLFARYKTSLINQVYRLEENQTIESFINDGHSLAIGFEGSGSWQLTTFWEMGFSLTTYREYLRASPLNGKPLLLHQSNVRLNQKLKLGNFTWMDLNWIYYGPGRQRYAAFKDRQKFDVTVRTDLWKKRIRLSLRLTDVLNTFNYLSQLIGSDFLEFYRFKGQTRVVFVNISYLLARGGNEPKRKRKKRNFQEAGTLE